ncbi:allophanate hydrolase [Pontiella agarivorans]|uniref:Allophanate hydrolase n=1 Tax=Pontiella agarivorans TaxID=3038953 RepID=A0ABU5MXK7_9BACT|nr:allophanate hydrolase [Pontiella agarivorans]MDZ8118956.1 allophanate hydrolase [Pontiella agarivorans]
MKSLQISALHQAYAKGEETVESVMEKCLQRADELAPEVWIRKLTAEEVAVYVQALEGESPETKPLYGIPFVIKDNIDLGGIPTTAGCPDYKFVPEQSAHVVEQLIQAGAIPLGKTNLDQFATGLVGTRSPYGACPNSFDPDYVSGGSSSGSAVAVADGCASFSLGTDTAGSGRVPAAFNNLIGLKPSKGLLSCSGVVPACKSLDCVSIFALDAADAQAVFDVANHFDPSDCYARELEQAPVISSGWKFGVPKREQLKFFGSREYESAFSESLDMLEKAGGTRVEVDFQPFLDAANLLYSGAWVNERHAAVGEFIEANPEAVLDTTRTIILSGLAIPAPDVFKGFYKLQEFKRVADEVMGSVDLIVTPTAGTPYKIDEVNADPVQLNTNLGYYTNYMNLLDYAAIAVPTALTPSVPFGVTLVSFSGHDLKLLQLADRLHQVSGLNVGKTERRPMPLELSPNKKRTIDVAVCGAHLNGYPLHHQLEDLGAVFVESTETAKAYRMFAFETDGIAKPGLIRDAENGGRIYVEIYRLTYQNFGKFVAAIPAPLGIGKIKLRGGAEVCGFIAEPEVSSLGKDITELGDWRKFAG